MIYGDVVQCCTISKGRLHLNFSFSHLRHYFAVQLCTRMPPANKAVTVELDALGLFSPFQPPKKRQHNASTPAESTGGSYLGSPSVNDK